MNALEGVVASSSNSNNDKARGVATTRRPAWKNDGKDGPNDPNTSERILLDWLASPGNYDAYKANICPRGGDRRSHGLAGGGGGAAEKLTTRTALCQQVADKIRRAGVRSPRTPQQVQTKIYRLEWQFRAACSYIRSDTGRCDRATDVRAYQKSIRRKCPNYYSLRNVMMTEEDSAAAATKEDKENNKENRGAGDSLVGTTIVVCGSGGSNGEEVDNEADDDDDDSGKGLADSGRAAYEPSSRGGWEDSSASEESGSYTDDSEDTSVYLERQRQQENLLAMACVLMVSNQLHRSRQLLYGNRW